jgi:cystathionine gamma-synthase
MPHHPETLAVTAGRVARVGESLGAAITPTSTYRAGGEWVYGREGNVGWLGFEAAISALEGGQAIAFSSGLAAVAAVVSTVPPGGIVVAPRTAYHGVIELLLDLDRREQIRLRRTDFTDLDQAMRVMDGAALIWAESPTNPMIDVIDLSSLVLRAKTVGAKVAVDSTLATPLLQQPLSVGADFVVHSATKYIGGHSDLLLGVVSCLDPALAASVAAHRHGVGAIPGALESFLALRGLRTLPVRLARSQQTAHELAQRLRNHPAVTRIRYPGLDSHPEHELAREQMSGFGAMVSFETVGDASDAERVCDGLELIVHGTSLGGVESLIERRARYAGDERQGVPATLLRMSVGLEHVDDLWADLEQALTRIHH